MITKELKPIPKHIIEKIKKIDSKCRLIGHNGTTYYSYFTKFRGDLTQITVACKTKNKQWLCKQIVVRPLHSKDCYVRDIEYSLFGYSTGWYYRGIGYYNQTTNYDKWCKAETKYYNVVNEVVNKSYILKQSQYKYSAINKYPYWDLIKYLRIYEEYPQAEYLVKMELSHFATNKSILKIIGKDKKFRKWIVANKEVLQNKYGNYDYISSSEIIYAYKHNINITESQKRKRIMRELDEDYNFRNHLKDIIKKEEIMKFYSYLEKYNIDCSSYWDYINACQYLGLDIEQNKYPKDFHRAHDIKIAEYEKAKLLADKKQRKELYENFKQVANKYISLQRNLNEDYVVVIAKSPGELIKEGKALDHCVGRMNYDQKFAREESLIFFIRNKEDINKPFVTMEYSLKTNKILQCYAKHNRKPELEVQDFVNKKWLPYANRKLKKLVA